MTSLPVWATMREAYRATWEHRWLLLGFAVAPLLLAVLFEYLAFLWFYLYTPRPDEGGLEISPLSEVIRITFTFLGQAAILPFLVQGFRTLLLGPAAVAGQGPIRIGRETLWLSAFTLVLFLVFLHPYLFQWPHLVAGWLSGLQFGSWEIYREHFILTFVPWILLWSLLVRLAFVYPSVSLGKAPSLGERWRDTRGNFWRLCGVFAVCLWPILMFEYLYGQLRVSLGQSCDFTVWSEGRADLFCWMEWLFYELIDQLILFTSATIWAAATSVAFAALTGYPARGVRVPSAPS